MKSITTPEERKDLIKDKIIHHLINEEEIKHVKFFSHVYLQPGEEVNYHEHHGEYEIYYMLKGEGTYSDNGKESIISAGAVTYCEDGNGHGLKNTSDKPLEFIALIVVL